jgi:heterodisulfide reductase subunit A
MYVSAVKESKCTGCGMCVVVCPYYARSIDKGRKIATVTPYLCDSCGACLVACPSEAAYLRDARGEMMVPYIDALLM